MLLKSLAFSNALIGYASLATLPMALEFIFGPMVEAHRTWRWWCVNGGAWLMACLLILAAPLLLPTFSLWRKTALIPMATRAPGAVFLYYASRDARVARQ